MQLYREPILNRHGEPVFGVSVTVKTSTGSLAALFSADGLSTSNPVTTDANGEAPFKAANGNYTITLAGISGMSATARTLLITLNDPDESSSATLAQLAAPSGAGLVKAVAIGSGAAAISVQDILREFIAITRYTGVVGDNATNCTDGIRAAIKANLHLEVPHGTFICGPTATSGDFLLYLGTNGGYQTARDGLTIKGRGPKSVLKLADNAGRNTLLFGASGADQIRDLTIRDLTIDLNGLNNLQASFGDPLRYNSAAYFICYCENVTFENVTFLNVSGHQMIRVGNDTAAGYGKNIRFKNCRVKNYGIGIPGNNLQDISLLYIQADGIFVTDNVIECDAFAFDPSRGHTGFELHGDGSTVVSRNRFKGVQLPWLIASSQKAVNNVCIYSNQYAECFYQGSLDGSYYDQKNIDIGPGESFTSTKSAAAILRIGNSAEVAKSRENVRYFGNTVSLWGNTNQDNHLTDLSDCYIKSLEVFGNTLNGLNGSVVYYAGAVRNSGVCDVLVHDNKLDSLGSTAGVYPNSPSFLHIETSSGTINTVSFKDNSLANTSGKNYATLGMVKLTGAINYVYVKGNVNAINSAYPLTTGTPIVLFKDIDRNYPQVWQESSYESGFVAIATGANLALFDFTGWANNDYSAFRVTVFSTDGGASNNGITDYDILVCGAGRVATRLANAGTYATDITAQFTGSVLQVHNANGATLYAKVVIRGTSSKPVAFTV